MDDRKKTERDSLRFWQALLIALLAHLLIAWLLDRSPEAFAAYFQLSPEQLLALEQAEDPPLRFEFVDIPDEPEVEPDEPEALSDRSRRARGQERPDPAPAPTDPDPYTEGNTAQKVQVLPQPEAEESVAELQPGATEAEAAAGEGAPAVGMEPDRPVPESPAESGLGEPEEPASKGDLLQSVPRISERELQESFDNPGGFSPMELGTVSFDTAAIDWGPYARVMLRIIRRNWIARLPPAARTGIKGVAVVNFRIAQDGSVSGISLIDSYGVRADSGGRYRVSDGVPPFENTSMASIEVSELPPLPDIFTSPDVGVTIGFFYNLRPPR